MTPETHTLSFNFTLANRLTATADVPVGQITALAGPSGAGKTTLLRCLAGVECANGKISYMGQIWLDRDNSIARPPHQRPVAMAAQTAHLLPTRTVAENLAFAYNRAIEPLDGETRAEIITTFDIQNLMTSLPAHLSGGEQKRVALAQALFCACPMILLDEPFAGLDIQRHQHIRDWLRSYLQKRRFTTIIATHNIDDMLIFCDQALWLADGVLCQSGSPKDVINHMLGVHQLSQYPQQIQPQISTILPVEKRGKADQWHMQEVTISGQAFSIPSVLITHNKPKFLIRIDARDVSVSHKSVKHISTQNQLKAIISDIYDDAKKPYCLISTTLENNFKSDNYKIHAWITKRALSAMNLCIGDTVFLLIKAASLHNEVAN